MKHWIKDALLDLVVLVVVIAYAYTSNNVINIILWIYTSLLLISKILFFFIGFLKTKATKTSVPDYFYHLIYLITVTLFLVAKDYYLAGAWALVWILSFIASIKKKKTM